MKRYFIAISQELEVVFLPKEYPEELSKDLYFIGIAVLKDTKRKRVNISEGIKEGAIVCTVNGTLKEVYRIYPLELKKGVRPNL